MALRGRKTLKYITRIDSGTTHCWWVRIGYIIEERVHKSFPDKRYGNRAKAFEAAKKWRDKELKRLRPLMDIAYNLDVNKQRHWGEGISESWSAPKNGWRYLNICGSYWDGRRNKQINKCFSVNKYGYDEAVKLAKQWRKLKITGEL